MLSTFHFQCETFSFRWLCVVHCGQPAFTVNKQHLVRFEATKWCQSFSTCAICVNEAIVAASTCLDTAFCNVQHCKGMLLGLPSICQIQYMYQQSPWHQPANSGNTSLSDCNVIILKNDCYFVKDDANRETFIGHFKALHFRSLCVSGIYSMCYSVKYSIIPQPFFTAFGIQWMISHTFSFLTAIESKRQNECMRQFKWSTSCDDNWAIAIVIPSANDGCEIVKKIVYGPWLKIYFVP